MGDLTIRDLDDALIVQLKRRAWYQGLPFEESLRRLLIASIVNDNDEFERAETQQSYYVVSGDGVAQRVPLHA
jgi:plasmid stability protein